MRGLNRFSITGCSIISVFIAASLLGRSPLEGAYDYIGWQTSHQKSRVEIWHEVPWSTGIQRVAARVNATNHDEKLILALTSVVLDPHLSHPNRSTLTAAIAIYDMKEMWALVTSPLILDLTFEAHARFSDNEEILILPGKCQGWPGSDDLFVDFEVPKNPFGRDDPNLELSVALHVLHESLIIAAFHTILRATYYPKTFMTICNKPLYTVHDYGLLLQWREHHRLLGIDRFHWSSQHSNFSRWVDALNAATSGQDTFDWRPTLAVLPDHEPFWDESYYVQDCFLRWRRTATFVGVWDFDEFLGTTDPENTSPKFIENFLLGLQPNVSSLILPFIWTGGDGGPAYSSSDLMETDSSLSEAEASAISKLKGPAHNYYLTNEKIEGAYQWHKSVHRVGPIEGVGVHRMTRWKEGSEQIWSLNNEIGDNEGLAIYHIRAEQAWIGLNYTEYPISRPIIQFWNTLAKRVHTLHQKLPEYFTNQH